MTSIMSISLVSMTSIIRLNSELEFINKDTLTAIVRVISHKNDYWRNYSLPPLVTSLRLVCLNKCYARVPNYLVRLDSFTQVHNMHYYKRHKRLRTVRLAHNMIFCVNRNYHTDNKKCRGKLATLNNRLRSLDMTHNYIYKLDINSCICLIVIKCPYLATLRLKEGTLHLAYDKLVRPVKTVTMSIKYLRIN